MATFTKLYLTTQAAGYTPATIRGAWDKTSGAVTKMLDVVKNTGGEITTVTSAETDTSTTYDVLLYRGVSGPLGAQTIGGNLDVMLGVIESNAAADFNWHIHVYVTQGDSDTPRGDLVADYTEAAGTNEFGTAAATNGLVLNAAQALNLAVSDGDRIAVEIGYIARNSSATSYTGTLNYGTLTSGVAADDLTAGAAGASLAGYISFSEAITEGTAPTARMSQAPLRVLRDADTSVRTARMSQAHLRVLRDGDTTVRKVRMSQAHLRVLYTVQLGTLLRHPGMGGNIDGNFFAPSMTGGCDG